MKSIHLLLASLCPIFGGSTAFSAEAATRPTEPRGMAELTTTNVPLALSDFANYKIISERNIFNPNRYRGSANRPVREPERKVRTDLLSLVGTMVYEKGRFAFFDGSASEFKKVAQADDRIGGFKVISVTPTCVKLEGTNGQKMDLCVGMQLKRREDEEWQLTGTPDSSSATPSGPEAEEVLKRLRQRREEEGAPAAPAPATATETATTETKTEPAASAADTVTDPILKKLLQKREQELNK